MAIVIRVLTADDWRAWRPVRLAALADAPAAFGSRLDDWADAPEHRWRVRLSIPGAHDLVAYDDRAGAPVGMASGVPAEAAGRAELISMWVDPAARGRGVASALIDEVVAWAIRARFDVLGLSVMPDNARAVAVYERNGFALTDESGELLPDGRRELVMKRDLRNARTLAAYEVAADRYIERTTTHRAGLVDDLVRMAFPGAGVLEVGSGPGRDADALEAAGLRVDRTDGARAFVERLRAAGHDARVLDVLRDDLGGPYDAVFANAVLLHVPRASLPDVLARVRGAVRPGGVLAATLKRGEGERWTARKTDVDRHFTYWTEDALAAVTTDAGWVDVQVRETTRPESEERWLTVLARRPTGSGS